MKYILVTGGVISGVGKGVIASSFGTLLKSCGLDVTSIKIDPYINIDAGTFSPYEHGKSNMYSYADIYVCVYYYLNAKETAQIVFSIRIKNAREVFGNFANFFAFLVFT